ncbi:MAG TPA: hypothetical protein VHG91_16870 [Longimicrobium sp.]|nr:hypothetical protein [Longimicrobium sp.]
MPGFLLHLGATVTCMHGGQATPTAPFPRVRVGGRPVTTLGAPWAVAGCGFAPPGGNGPCVTAQWVSAAVRVRAGGQPVLLQDSQAVCAPTGTGVIVAAAQPRVKGT